MLPFGLESVVIYVTGFVAVCTANAVSLQRCLDVQTYVPGYINDLVEYVRYKPYEKEQIYLSK
jgi:hypothetical protein